LWSYVETFTDDSLATRSVSRAVHTMYCTMKHDVDMELETIYR